MRLALYRGTSWISQLIRWQSRSCYSHAAFLLDGGSVIEAWPPRVREVKDLSAQHNPGTVVDIFGFEVALSALENRLLEGLARKDIGTAYDYLAVLRFLTRRAESERSKRKLFCSEQLFARCGQIGRELLARTEAWRVPPDWIARSPVLRFEERVVTR